MAGSLTWVSQKKALYLATKPFFPVSSRRKKICCNKPDTEKEAPGWQRPPPQHFLAAGLGGPLTEGLPSSYLVLR